MPPSGLSDNKDLIWIDVEQCGIGMEVSERALHVLVTRWRSRRSLP